MHIKLKGSPGIFIVGFMGCGKSTAGRALSRGISWPFVDLDDEIERRAGKSIAAVFDEDGEDAFRDHEHEAVKEQASLVRRGRPRVVALGGGAFAFERNRRALENAGVSIWLDAGAETLWRRISEQDHRPLAQDYKAYAELLACRRPAYAQADFRVNAGGSPEETLAHVAALKLF